MIFNISKIAKELNINLPDLITRLNGRLMYGRLTDMLSNIQDGEIIIIDFNKIKVIDASFIDEFIIRLKKNSINSEKKYFIKLKNLSKSSEINIDSLFNTYFNYKNEKLVVNTEDICQNNNFFIGPLSDMESDIMNFLRVNRRAIIQDFIEFTLLNKDEIIELMDNLYSLRVVRRDNDYYSSI